MLELISGANGILWGPPALVLLFLVGIFLTVGSKFIHFRKIVFITKRTLGSLKAKDEDSDGTISKVAAVCASLAATVGMGNIVGVASALISGGPGAVFWMVLAAFLGMVMKYFEVCLAIHYRKQNADGEYYGGPALYMSEGLKKPWLGYLIIVLTVLACLGSNMIQSNVLASNLSIALSGELSPLMVAAPVTLVVGFVVMGGIKRLGFVSTILVPTMALLYLLGGIVVLAMNSSHIPEAFALIIEGAFAPVSVAGGALGYGIVVAARYGIARGFFSNGGGQACYCIAHAPAKVKHPVEQGIWAVTEVLIDVAICLITAFAILTSGISFEGANSAILATQAFAQHMGFLEFVISIALVLFTFTTVIGFCYMGESQLNLIFKPSTVKFYRYLFLVFTFTGVLVDITILWDICDFIFGIIMFVNLPVLVILSPLVFKMTTEYFNNPTLYK